MKANLELSIQRTRYYCTSNDHDFLVLCQDLHVLKFFQTWDCFCCWGCRQWYRSNTWGQFALGVWLRNSQNAIDPRFEMKHDRREKKEVGLRIPTDSNAFLPPSCARSVHLVPSQKSERAAAAAAQLWKNNNNLQLMFLFMKICIQVVNPGKQIFESMS